MQEKKSWKNKPKAKSVTVKIEVELENLEDLPLCLETIKKQLEAGIPYTEGVIKKGMYYTASLDYKAPADYREEEIGGKYYRIINKTTNNSAIK